jgi:light-harvesting complex 1 beta chain
MLAGKGGEERMANDNDLVPAKWKPLFNNEEWLVHGIVVQSMWGFGVIAFIAHILILLWRPWF